MAFFNKQVLLQKIFDYPVVPVFYHADAALTINILQSCYNGGMRVFEFTNRGKGAELVFEKIYKYVRENCPEMAIGIGTIFIKEQADRFIDLGADFIVQPVTTQEVADACALNSIAWVPGAATPTEIYKASQLGAELIKIFPANILGPGFVKGLRGPMPDVKLMATGGVEPSIESISSWMKAGINVVGIGSQLFPEAMIKEGKFEKITQQISTLMKEVKNMNSK